MAQDDLLQRVAKLEEGKTACKKTQDERHAEIISKLKADGQRMTRIEDRHVYLLTTALVTLLGVVSTLIVLLLKK